MSMSLSAANVFVIVAAVLQGAAAAPSANPPQPLEPAAEPGAYAIYGVILEQVWNNSKDAPVLQQETEPTMDCPGFLPKLTGEWAEAAEDFQRKNIRERTLQPALPVTFPYRLIHRAEIQADDARLAKKYPGIMNRRPESIDYWAVSVVGFNRNRTKAIVNVRGRTQGGIRRLEAKNGQWVDAPGLTCGWIT
jgi:hypothetical protein